MVKVGRLYCLEERGPYDINGQHIEKYWLATISCVNKDQKYGRECFQFKASPEKICKLAGVGSVNDLINKDFEYDIRSQRLDDVREVK